MRLLKAASTGGTTDGADRAASRWDSKPLAWGVSLALSSIFIASFIYSPAARSPHEQYFTLCAFKILTGLPCPACGLTHSFCAMARADFSAAFGFNLLGPALFLVLVAMWARALGVLSDKRGFVSALDSRVSRFKPLRALVVAFIVFGAARIIYVLVTDPAAFGESPLARLFRQVLL
jgi:hypothetical protein